MILTESRIKNAVLSVHNDYDKNVEYEAKLDLLVNGKNFTDYLIQISNLENKEQEKLRKRYAISTKNIAEKTIRPLDKIFSAQGGYFDVLFKSKSEQKKAEFIQTINNCANGESLSFFLENIWAKRYVDSPRSVFFIENSIEKGAYPVFIKQLFITNWKLKNYYEYDFIVIKDSDLKLKRENANRLFNVPKDFKINIPSATVDVYRVVDDAYDYTVLKYDNDKIKILFDGESVEIDGIEYKTYKNILGFVPAVQISKNISNDLINKNSILEPVLELLSNYLLDNSILRIYKFLHGYPYFWFVEDPCPICAGTGFNGEHECEACGGTGVARKKDVSDGRAIRRPDPQETNIIPNIAGYIQPALETWTKMNEDLAESAKDIFYTIWGTYIQEDSRYQTATGRLIDSQPVNDKLVGISKNLDFLFKWICNTIGKYMYQEDYDTCLYASGTDYLLQTSSELFESYINAKQKGACDTELTELLNKYYSTLYQNNPKKFEISKKDIIFEPYRHLSVSEVERLYISETIKNRKRYYNEFRKTLNDTLFITYNIERFNSELDIFINQKILSNEQNRISDTTTPQSQSN